MTSVSCDSEGGVIVGPDAALASLLGAGTPGNLIGRALTDFIHVEDRPGFEAALGFNMGRREMTLRLLNGAPVRVLMQRTGMFTARFELQPQFAFALPEEPVANSLWVEPALFSRWLASEIERAHRYQAPLSALRVCLPTTGNPDATMRDVCQALPDMLRACDAVSQLSRRLVVALMPSTGLAGAEVVSSRLQAAVNLAIPQPAVAEWARGTSPRTFYAWLLDGEARLDAA